MKQFLQRYQQCKGWLFGFRFKRRQLEKLDAQFIQYFGLTSTGRRMKCSIRWELRRTSSHLCPLCLTTRVGSLPTWLRRFMPSYLNPAVRMALAALAGLDQDFVYVTKDILAKRPKTREKLSIGGGSFAALCENKLTEMPETEFNHLVRYVGLTAEINKEFASVPTVRYANQQSAIQDLVTVEMTYLLDGRVIDFYEQNRATAKALRDIIRSKQRFPKEEFGRLKKAFPCILAGIRDYAEYIPLEPEIFDLLIIDEASQVSIAQAFPASAQGEEDLDPGRQETVQQH